MICDFNQEWLRARTNPTQKFYALVTHEAFEIHARFLNQVTVGVFV